VNFHWRKFALINKVFGDLMASYKMAFLGDNSDKASVVDWNVDRKVKILRKIDSITILSATLHIRSL